MKLFFMLNHDEAVFVKSQNFIAFFLSVCSQSCYKFKFTACCFHQYALLPCWLQNADFYDPDRSVVPNGAAAAVAMSATCISTVMPEINICSSVTVFKMDATRWETNQVCCPVTECNTCSVFSLEIPSAP